MDVDFFREALFGGKTANAVKLATVLTRGRFWVRIGGVTLLYRGKNSWQIDFGNILTSAGIDVKMICPPAYAEHSNNCCWFYLVRRVNCCGYQECTLSAIVKFSLDANGQPDEPVPNSIYNVSVKQLPGQKVQLGWYYSPLQQQARPKFFNVYGDNCSSQIDYNSLLASIPYIGRRFYCYQSDGLEPGRCLFVIKSNGDGAAESSAVQLCIDVVDGEPAAAEITEAEAL